MRYLFAIAMLLASVPAGFAQTEVTGVAAEEAELIQLDEVIDNMLPGVYSVTITLDRRLEDYPGLMNSVRETELGHLAEFAALAINDHRSWLEDSPGWSWNEWFSDTVISISFSNADVVSLDRRTSFYTGGAHPNQARSPVVTRADGLNPVGLDVLLADTAPDSPALTALFYAVYRELMALKRERLGSDFDEVMERETWLAPLAPEVDAFPGFTLMANQSGEAAGGLMFHFEPYEVGSYAEGSYDVPVPLSVFDAYLTEDWAAVFDGLPGQDVLTETGDALEPIGPEAGD
jgi:Protein of unknown function (DUF3298)